MLINHQSQVRLRAGVLWRDLGGVVIVLDGTTGRYFRLHGSASDIWRSIDAHQSLELIVDALSRSLDDPRASIERDIRTFVDTAIADGLLETVDTPQGAARRPLGTVPTLQIGSSGLTVNGSLEPLRAEFAQNHHVHLPQFIAADLLTLVRLSVEAGEFVDRTHHGIGTEQCLVPGTATSILQLTFNDPALLQAITEIAACDAVRCFDGRVYRMAPGAGHYDSWHSDAGENRLVAVSVNLSAEPYEGGLLEIRQASSTETAQTVSNSGLGNAVMFQISPALRHRVSAVTGSHARTAYAGWFRSAPDFHDPFFASLPKS